jgi:hypothetical protein
MQMHTWFAEATPVVAVMDGVVKYSAIYKEILGKSDEGLGESIANGAEAWKESWADYFKKNPINCVVIIECKNTVGGKTNTLRFIYTNMVCPCVVEGDIVKAGEVIGTIGGSRFSSVSDAMTLGTLPFLGAILPEGIDFTANGIVPKWGASKLRESKIGATGNELKMYVVEATNGDNVYDPSKVFKLTKEEFELGWKKSIDDVQEEMDAEGKEEKSKAALEARYEAYKKDLELYNKDAIGPDMKRQLQLKHGLAESGLNVADTLKLWSDEEEDAAAEYDRIIKNEIYRTHKGSVGYN